MNEQEFEHLWEKAATEHGAAELAAGFPAWRIRYKRRRNAIMGIAAVCVMGVSMWFGIRPEEKGFDSVACNRTGYTDEYWAQLANEMLITEV